jgi:hypothetical protein
LSRCCRALSSWSGSGVYFLGSITLCGGRSLGEAGVVSARARLAVGVGSQPAGIAGGVVAARGRADAGVPEITVTETAGLSSTATQPAVAIKKRAIRMPRRVGRCSGRYRSPANLYQSKAKPETPQADVDSAAFYIDS